MEKNEQQILVKETIDRLDMVCRLHKKSFLELSKEESALLFAVFQEGIRFWQDKIKEQVPNMDDEIF